MMMNKTLSLTALLGLSTLFLGAVTPAGALCSNGLAGVDGDEVCCTEGCTICGGAGCDPDTNLVNNTLGLTADDCCSSNIADANVTCDVSQAAPCIITTAPADPDSVCDNGVSGIQDADTDVCCPLACGEGCGGVGCGSIAGVEAALCCASIIIESGLVCSETVGAPCNVVATANSNATCSNGLNGVENAVDLVCCNAACGQCGGTGCGTVPGLTAADCCSSNITASGQSCTVTGTAPCTIDPPPFEPSMCPNGLAGVQDGTVCCAEACGQCGGTGCGTIVGTEGSSDCCSDTILVSGQECGNSVVAPCIMPNGTFTNAPAAAPTLAPGAGVTEAPLAADRGVEFTSSPTIFGDVDGNGLVNSADTNVPGDTNGDGVANDLDDPTKVGDTNGDGVVNSQDEIVGLTDAPSTAPTGASTMDGTLAPGATAAPTNGDRGIDGTLSPAGTPSPADTNGDGVVDSADGIEATPIPSSANDDVDAGAEGSGAMSAVVIPSGAVYAGAMMGAALAGGGAMLLL